MGTCLFKSSSQLSKSLFIWPLTTRINFYLGRICACFCLSFHYIYIYFYKTTISFLHSQEIHISVCIFSAIFVALFSIRRS